MKKTIVAIFVFISIFLLSACTEFGVASQMTIQFDGNGGDLVSGEEEQLITEVSSLNPPTYSYEGYRFIGWDIELASIKDDCVVHAQWEQIDYVTVRIRIHNGADIREVIVEKGTPLGVFEAPQIEGYTYDNLYLNDVAHNPEQLMTENVTLTAKYTINQYNIIIVDGDVEESIAFTYGSLITLTEPTKEGYAFAGWNIDVPIIMPAHDVTIEPVWEVSQYQLTIHRGYDQEDETRMQDFGSNITLDSPTKEGFTFQGWDLDIPFTMPAHDVTVSAVWQVNSYTLTLKFDDDTEDIVRTFNYGAWILETLDCPIKGDYYAVDFDYLIPDHMPAHDVVLELHWSKIPYQLIFYSTLGEIYECQEVVWGTEIDLIVPDPTKPGYRFMGWTPIIPTIMPNQNLEFEAIWEAETYRLHFNGTNTDYLEYDTLEVTFGEAFTYPDCTRGDFIIYDWYNENSVAIKEGIWTFDYDQDEEITLTPKWTIGFFENGLNYCYYGKYPQSHVNSPSLIEELNKLTTVNEFGYYEYQGEEYVKMMATPLDLDFLYKDGSPILNAEAWFKVEPIKWIVTLFVNNDLGFQLLPVYLLDVMYFSDDDMRYSESHLREYLNNDFYNLVFSLEEKENIIISDVINNEAAYSENTVTYSLNVLHDYLWSLDITELRESHKRTELTDYAIARGASLVIAVNKETGATTYYGNWWLRTQIISQYKSDNAFYYKSYFDEIEQKNGLNDHICFRPYLKIDLK